MRRSLNCSRRELILLLLIAVLLLVHPSQLPEYYSRYAKLNTALGDWSHLFVDDTDLIFLQKQVPSSLFPAHTVSWSGAVPETTIVQHAPGEFS